MPRLPARGKGRRAARGTCAPGGHRADPRADPRPRRLPGPGHRRAARSSPHLQAGPRCRPRDKSVQLTRRGEGRRSRSPAHHPRPPLRASRSPLGILPREPPYYGATKLRSLPSPRLFFTSLTPSLAPSLPPISSSPPAACPASSTLRLRLQVGGDKQPTNRKKGPAPSHRPLPLAPPTTGTNERGTSKKNGR